MKLRKLLKDEKGAVLPLVTIILGLFALGFIALVVDIGILYVERKAMITSADAAALAGSEALRVSKGANVSEAELVAKNYAIANGADESQVTAKAEPNTVTLPNGETDYRQTVEVTVGKNQPLIFARFLGDESTDVKAHAIATWGYVHKTYIGSFIPIFAFDTDYSLNTDIYLHEKVEDSNSYGFIDIGSGMGDIKEAIAGDSVSGTYIYDNQLDGKAGQGDALRLSVEDRMQKATDKGTWQERRDTMIGLVPIIDKESFLDINEGKLTSSSAQWKLPIKYFAYFEIMDVIQKNGSTGSAYALDPNPLLGDSNRYKGLDKLGESRFNYSTDSNVGTRPEYTLVKGRFVGNPVYAKTIVEIGDQEDPNPEGDTPATYSKLIK